MFLKDVKVVYKSLGHKKVLGLAYKEEMEIHIDKKLKGFLLLDVNIHELLHIYFPDITEEEIDSRATAIAKSLWSENWRKVDN